MGYSLHSSIKTIGNTGNVGSSSAYAGGLVGALDSSTLSGSFSSGQVTLTVSDQEFSVSETFTIAVTAVNDAPVILSVSDSLTMVQGSSLTLSLADVTVSDVDHVLNDLSLILVAGANYSVSGLLLTPDAGLSGTLPVDVAVYDGIAFSDTATMLIHVTPLEKSSSSQASSSSQEKSSSSKESSSSQAESSSSQKSSSSSETFSSSSQKQTSWKEQIAREDSFRIRLRAGSLQISYSIAQRARVDLVFYNMLGVQVHAIQQGMQLSGQHDLIAEVHQLQSGRYIAVLKLNGTIVQKKSFLSGAFPSAF